MQPLLIATPDFFLLNGFPVHFQSSLFFFNSFLLVFRVASARFCNTMTSLSLTPTSVARVDGPRVDGPRVDGPRVDGRPHEPACDGRPRLMCVNTGQKRVAVPHEPGAHCAGCRIFFDAAMVPPPIPELRLAPITVASATLVKKLSAVRGSLGALWLARNDTTNVLIVVKCAPYTPGSSEDILNEWRTMRDLQHHYARQILDAQPYGPAAVAEMQRLCTAMRGRTATLYGAATVGEDVYLAMRYAPGKDLFNMISAHGRFGEDGARLVLQSLLPTLIQLHATGVAHCDLKPENVMVIHHDAAAPLVAASSVHTYLVDFGQATLEVDVKTV